MSDSRPGLTPQMLDFKRSVQGYTFVRGKTVFSMQIVLVYSILCVTKNPGIQNRLKTTTVTSSSSAVTPTTVSFTC